MPGGGATPGLLEIEWQFDAIDLAAVERSLLSAASAQAFDGLVVQALPPQRLLDTYLDTEDWRLGRARFMLRVRRQARQVEATLKDLAKSEDGLRTRLEVSEPLGADGISTLSHDGPVGWRVRALAGVGKLQPILEVQTRRRRYALVRSGEGIGEVALDETNVRPLTGPTRRLHLQRVEIEVPPGEGSEVRALVERLRAECGLQPALLSKFEAGLLCGGLRLPGPPELGPTELRADQSLAEVAFAVLRSATQTMLAHEAGTRLGEDPEDLHQMRVATRRLRAALALFADVLPLRSAHLRDEIGWVAAALGAVRDLDVQLEKLEELSSEADEEHAGDLARVQARLQSARRARRLELSSVLDSRRYARLVAGLSAMLVQGPPRRSARTRLPAVVGLPELIGRRHRAVRKAARRAHKSGEAEDFHKLRIACKRLRYALDPTGPIYGAPAKRFARRLASLQDELGAMQDAVVAAEQFRALAVEPPPEGGEELGRGAVFFIGGLAERRRMEAERLLEDLRGRKRLGQKGWAELDAAMGKALRAASAGVGATRTVSAWRPQLQPVRANPGRATAPLPLAEAPPAAPRLYPVVAYSPPETVRAGAPEPAEATSLPGSGATVGAEAAAGPDGPVGGPPGSEPTIEPAGEPAGEPTGVDGAR